MYDIPDHLLDGGILAGKMNRLDFRGISNLCNPERKLESAGHFDQSIDETASCDAIV
jgi:hypothetical protein